MSTEDWKPNFLCTWESGRLGELDKLLLLREKKEEDLQELLPGVQKHHFILSWDYYWNHAYETCSYIMPDYIRKYLQAAATVM